MAWLETPSSIDGILVKTAYVLTNPVAARLVPSGRLWLGLWSAPELIGQSIEVERPKHFFNPKGTPEPCSWGRAAHPVVLT